MHPLPPRPRPAAPIPGEPPDTSPAVRRRRPTALLGALGLGIVLALGAVAWAAASRHATELTAVRGHDGSVVFVDPHTRQVGERRITTGAVEVRGRGGAPLQATGRMVVDPRHPERNRLEVRPSGPWVDPLGRRGLVVQRPVVTTRWQSGGFTAAVSGQADRTFRAPRLTAISGPNGASAALPASRRASAAVEVPIGPLTSVVTTPSVDLGPVDLGPLHIEHVTTALEIQPDLSFVGIVHVDGVRGALGPVSVTDASGSLRLPLDGHSAAIALQGTLSVGGSPISFTAELPASLQGSQLVLGPHARLHVGVGDGLDIDTEVAVDLAAPAGGDLVSGTARVTYGTLTADTALTLGTGDHGITAGLSLTRPLALGSGVTITDAALSWDGEAVGLTGTAHLAGQGADLSARVAGTVHLGSDGVPQFDITTDADGTLALAGSQLSLDGGLELVGDLGGTLDLTGRLRLADSTVDVTGQLEGDGGGSLLSLLGPDGSEAQVHLSLDRSGTVRGSVAVDHLVVAGVPIDDARVAVVWGHGSTHLDLQVGTARLPGGRTASLSGSLDVPPDATVALQVHGVTDVLGPSVTLDGTALAAGGRLDVDLTAATGTTVDLGAGQVTLGGQLRIRGDVFGQLRVTGALDLAGNHIDLPVTLGVRFDRGAVVFELPADGGADQPSLTARYDLSSGHLTGTAQLGRFDVQGVGLVDASLGIDLGGGHDVVTVDAHATLAQGVEVQVSGEIGLDGATSHLRAVGTAVVAGAPVEVTGDVDIDHGVLSWRATASADDVHIPLGGDDLVLAGKLQLSGDGDGPVQVAAQVQLYGRTLQVTGTMTFPDGSVRLVLDGKDGLAGLHADVRVDGSGSVSGTVTVDRLDVAGVTLTGVRLDVSSAGGVLGAQVVGHVAWRDVALDVSGSISRRADGTLSLVLDAAGDLPLGAGVNVHQVHLATDGTTVDLSGQAHLLIAPADVNVAVSGTVTLGDHPTFDLDTQADGTVPLGDDRDLALTGALHLSTGHGTQILVDGAVTALTHTQGFSGSFGQRGDRVILSGRARDPEATLHLNVDLDARSASGHLRVANLALGGVDVQHADLGLSVADGRASVDLAGAAAFGPSLSLDDFTAHAGLSDGVVTLDLHGSATVLGRFADVQVGGSLVLGQGEPRIDVTAGARSSLDFDGHGDLAVEGGFHLSGTVGGPLAVSGTFTALRNQAPFTGSLSGAPGDGRLALTDPASSGAALAASASFGVDGIAAHVDLVAARLGVLRVGHLSIDGTVATDGALAASLHGDAQLADPDGRVAGITDAGATISGTYRRTADGEDHLALQADIDHLRATGGLDIELVHVQADISKAAQGTEVTASATATLPASLRPDGTAELPDTPNADLASGVTLTGSLSFTPQGTIDAWHVGGRVDRLATGDLVLSASLDASGQGTDGPARLRVVGDVVAQGGTIDGHLEGDAGFADGALQLELRGTLGVHDLSGLNASFEGHTAGRGFDVTGDVSYGPLDGKATGHVELATWQGKVVPRFDLALDAWTRGKQPTPDVHSAADLDDAVLVDVSLSNHDDPGVFQLRAHGLGAASVDLFGHVLQGKAIGGLGAYGTLRLDHGAPSYQLTLDAMAVPNLKVLGFLPLATGADAHLDVSGDFAHISGHASVSGSTTGYFGPVPLLGASGRGDVWFSGDLDGSIQVGGAIRAGASLLGPVISARADVPISGTVDMAAKKATINIDGSATASVLWIVATGSASGWATVHVDFSTPGAAPVVTADAGIDLDANVLLWQVYGLHASLHYDGHALWVTGGDKYLYGDGFFVEKRRVVDLRGQLYPSEWLCGTQQRRDRFWGSWSYESGWGDCRGMDTVSGQVRVDADGSGDLSPGDTGLGGVTVELRRIDGSLIRTTTTADNGTWSMSPLDEWSWYRVAVVSPDGRPVLAGGGSRPTGVIDFATAQGELRDTGVVLLGAVPPPPTSLVESVAPDAAAPQQVAPDGGAADPATSAADPGTPAAGTTEAEPDRQPPGTATSPAAGADAPPTPAAGSRPDPNSSTAGTPTGATDGAPAGDGTAAGVAAPVVPDASVAPASTVGEVPPSDRPRSAAPPAGLRAGSGVGVATE